MYIKALRGFVGESGKLKANEIVEVSDAFGKHVINQGFAVKADKPVKKAAKKKAVKSGDV